METEAEYEKWFDKYLGDFEVVGGDGDNNTIFNYTPKPFNISHWIKGLILFIVLFIILSFLFYNIKLNFLFNISLSISTGLIVNLIFLIITSAKDRHINYYSNLIPILQKRRNKLHDAYFQCHPQMSIAFQQNDRDKWYKYWHRLVNLAYVAINFHNYLIRKIPNDYKYINNFETILDKLTELNNDSYKLIDNDKKIGFKHLHTECEKELYVVFTIILQLDELIEQLQVSLYSRIYKN